LHALRPRPLLLRTAQNLASRQHLRAIHRSWSAAPRVGQAEEALSGLRQEDYGGRARCQGRRRAEAIHGDQDHRELEAQVRGQEALLQVPVQAPGRQAGGRREPCGGGAEHAREARERQGRVVRSGPAGPALPKEPSMKCKVKVGELRDALQMAAITVDRRQGSELGYVHLGSRKGKAGNQRIILNSTDGIGRFLIRVPCEVEETGDLVIEPIRLSSLLDRRQEDELVVFAQDKELVLL